MNKVLTVSEITHLIKVNLENEFSEVIVEGEISNMKQHASGHWYFNLKDASAVICCTMWRSYNNYVFFTPEDGMKIIISGKVSVYPPRGNYQIDVRSMKPAGEGELQAAFEKLKRKLAAEGLFESIHKKPIPRFPSKIGIVTAIDGAAFKDMISIAKRRYPLVQLIICPARVQGEGAAQSIVKGVNEFNKREDIDIVIIGRGGGSLEDLWPFNEEVLARAVFNSRIPVVSAVGHEIDFTISDFVADMRAPTPSAAMEICTPNKEDILNYLNEFSLNSSQNISYIIEAKKQNVSNCLNSYGFRVPMDKVRIKMQQVDNLLYKLILKVERKLEYAGNRLALLGNKLEANNINRILKRGFALIKQDSGIITRKTNFNESKPASINFYDGEIKIVKQ